MADNRKYYYLKLKENFFDSDSIVLLEDMKDGILTNKGLSTAFQVCVYLYGLKSVKGLASLDEIATTPIDDFYDMMTILKMVVTLGCCPLFSMLAR